MPSGEISSHTAANFALRQPRTRRRKGDISRRVKCEVNKTSSYGAKMSAGGSGVQM
jgi:hypothetical protein